MFLIEKEIKAPRFVTYQICTEYLPWREKPDVKAGKYNAGTNTAIFDMKVFRWLLKEAVKREYCSGNPAREVTLKKKPRKLYSDYSDERMQEIYAAIKLEPEPELTCFLRSFALASLHGCRLNETNVNPMTDVDLSGEIPTIRFLQKGNRERFKPLHPQLIPLYTKLKKEKAILTYPMEKDENGRFRWGNRWTKFWHRHGFKDTDPNGCFHSLRVVVENALREAKVELEIREAYLTHEHGSAEVNALYDRIKLREMLVCHAPLNRPWLVLV
jgi:integrase